MKYKELQSHFLIETTKHLNNAMSQITNLLKRKDINFVFIGGAILGKYGYNRMTEDVDILVSLKDKNKLMKLSPGFFKFNDSGRKGRFHKTKTLVDVLYSGDNVGENSKIILPEPDKVSVIVDGVPVLSLQSLIEFKLGARLFAKNRLRDDGDIQALIISNDLDREFMSHLRKDLKEKYQQIWDSTDKND